MSVQEQHARCQSNFVGAVKLLKSDSLNSTIAWEVLSTIDRCSKLGESKRAPYNDMAALATSYRKLSNINSPGGTEALMSTSLVDENLEQACQRAVAHYRDFTEKMFLHNLTWWNWLKYECLERPDKLAGLVGVLSFGLYVPRKAAQYATSNAYIQRKWRENSLWKKFKTRNE